MGSGLFDDVLTQDAPAQPSKRNGLFDDVLDFVRSAATAGLQAPLAADRAVKSELLRLGKVSQAVPSFQSVSAPLGQIVRAPLKALNLPTGVMAGFAPGTQVGDVARGVEEKSQDIALAGLADIGATHAVSEGINAVGQGVSNVARSSRITQMLQESKILNAPVEDLIVRAKRSGSEGADIAKVLLKRKSPKFQAVFDALVEQRQSPRGISGLLPNLSERGSVKLPQIGDVFNLEGQPHKVTAIDPVAEMATLAAVEGGKAITIPLAQIAAQNKPVFALKLKDGQVIQDVSAKNHYDVREGVATGARISQPTQPLVRVREQAISAVLRELRDQASIFGQAHGDLKRRIMEAGGIKPTLAGGMREELQAIRPFLRVKGQPIDTLATELGFEDGEALRKALAAGHGAKMPKFSELRQQAIQVVDSQPGQRILEALQTKQATGKSIRGIVRDVTKQMKAELLQGQKQIRGVLSEAQRKAMTPAQLARYSRLQRITPGETITGPRGGTLEAPLNPADIRRVEATTANILPPRMQPTGTKPIIPVNRSLAISNEPKPVRDLTEFQGASLSGLDPHRAAAVVDGHYDGPTARNVVQPMRKAELAQRKETMQVLGEFRSLLGKIRPGSKESKELFWILEGRVPAGAPVPANLTKIANWMRTKLDQLLDDVNQVRTSLGKNPIIRREGYITHLQDTDFLKELKGAFSGESDELTVSLADKAREFFRSKVPFFRFGLPRKGSPFTEDAVKAFEAYVPVALRVKHLSIPGRLASVYVNRALANTPRAGNYFSQYIESVVSNKQGPLAQLFPKTLVRGMTALKGRFAKGTILGNLSSVLQQPFTLPATVSATSPKSAALAAHWMTLGKGMEFAEQWSDTVKGRMYEIDYAFSSFGSKLENMLAAPFGAADRAMVSHAFLSGYLEAISKGLSFEEAVKSGDQVAFQTQSSFLRADLAPIFRDEVSSGFVQFQNTINGVFNYIKADIGIHPGTPNWWITVGKYAGTLAAMLAIYEYLGLPKPDKYQEYVPGISTMRGGPPVFRIAQSLFNLGNNNPQERAKALSELKSYGVALAVGAGGGQLRKAVQGGIAISQGGQRDKRGKLLFPIRTFPEKVRAVAFGPYQTKAGQAYLDRKNQPKRKRTVNLLDAFATAPPADSQEAQATQRGGLFDDVLNK